MTDTSKIGNYKWWKDKKMIGTFILVISISFFLFSYMSIPMMTSIHKYTFGMLLGWYHPFIYVYIIYYSLTLIFDDKVKLPKWVKLTKVSYSMVVLSLVLISTQTGYFQSKGNWTEIGPSSFHSIKNWWDAFRSSGDAWAPAATNGGFIGAFLYSLFAMMVSGVGSLVIAITSLAISISILITGTTIGFYKQMITNKRLYLQKKEIIEDKNSELPIKEEKEDSIELKTSEPKEGPFPFDDPFK